MNIETLRTRQAWTLAQKIDHSLGVIDQFASHFDGQVYVSFSGGKDSVAMLSLVEVIIPKVKCMFVMTGCESPSVCRFIRQMKADGKDIDIVRPRKTLRQVFADYGFPLVSKDVSHNIAAVRRNPYCESSRKMLWLGNPHHIPERWMYLLNEPYQVSDRCCFWLKKQPGHEYTKQTGRRPYIGTTASESRTRTAAYLRRGGCNAFGEDGKQLAASWPLAIWKDEDIWSYIRDRGLRLPDIYEQGANRTGCMACGFGCQRGSTALTLLYKLYPKWYAMMMDYENDGTTYREALRTMLSKVGRRLPDDHDPSTD